jgi:hypothetical protein
MIQWIFFVLPSSFERSDARVPLVVTSQTVACAGNPKRGVAARQVWLSVHDLHRTLRLTSL